MTTRHELMAGLNSRRANPPPGSPLGPRSALTPTSSPIGDSSDALFTSPDALAQALKRFLGSSDEAVDYLGRTLEVLASTLSSPQGEHQFAEDEENSREEMQIIKAKTMYNMVEDIDDGKCKLLFLTNPQAELIASSPESVQRMLDVLEVPKPSLVIEMLQSWGFRASTTVDGVEVNQPLSWPGASGIIAGRPPFLSREEEREAEAKIDVR